MAQANPSCEFEPLFKAARPTLYQTNAFRVLGASVDAGFSELSRQLQKIEMVQRFGLAAQTPPSGMMPLTSVPALSLLQDAKQKLSNPESRLIEEFFWFWPEVAHGSKDDLAFQSLQRNDLQSATDIWLRRSSRTEDTSAIHNLAILFHVQALDSVTKESLNGNVPEAPWIMAWKYWRTLVACDPFWRRLAARVEELDDPRLTTKSCGQIRGSLCAAILQIDVGLAISAAEAGDFRKATEHLRIANESGFPPEVIRDRTEHSLLHIRIRIEHLCDDAERRVSDSVEKAPGILTTLLADARPYLEALNYLLGAGNRLRDAVHDRIAGTSRSILIAYGNKTEDWRTCQQLFAGVQPLAVSESLRKQVADDVETVQRNAVWKKLWADVKPIDSAPSLRTINGIGFAIHGRSDYDTQTGSHAATYYFTLFFVPLLPVRRYRVIPTPGGYRFLGRLPLRRFDKWHLGIVLGLILIWLLSVVAGDSSSSSSRTYPTTPSYPVSTTPAPAPVTNGPGSETSTTPESVDADASSRRDVLRREIDENKQRLTTLSSGVDSCERTLQDYRATIASDRARLDEMESDSGAGGTVDQGEYESVRARHNSNVRLYNSQLGTCRSLAEQHDALVDETNTQIREYNQLIGAR